MRYGNPPPLQSVNASQRGLNHSAMTYQQRVKNLPPLSEQGERNELRDCAGSTINRACLLLDSTQHMEHEMTKTELLTLADALPHLPMGVKLSEGIDKAAAALREYAGMLDAEPVAWVDPLWLTSGGSSEDMFMDTQPHPSCEWVPLYAIPPSPQRTPLTEIQRMRIIGDEFPLFLVDPIVIEKVDSVCLAIEAAHGITAKEKK
jgi:hypothetical protein